MTHKTESHSDIPSPYGNLFGYQDRVRENLADIRQRGTPEPRTDYSRHPFAALRELPLRAKVAAGTAIAIVAAGVIEAPAIGRFTQQTAHSINSLISHGAPGDTSDQARPVIDQAALALAEKKGLVIEGYPLDPEPKQIYRDEDGRIMMLVGGDGPLLDSVPYERWSGEQQQALYEDITDHGFTGHGNG